jgi:glycosyltransferase involved in cell wall biosynthesis
MKKNNLLVSIFCPTYNHSKYIEQCLNGIVMQKTNFQFEVIVQDDASTDDSQKIIKEFAEKYNFIVPVLHTENIYSKGVDLNEYFVKNAKGKYIAFCEGDDYWTDPYKLQKQVDFLETNPDYGLVHTDYDMLFQKSGKIVKAARSTSGQIVPTGYIYEDQLLENSIKTLTILSKRSIVSDALKQFGEKFSEWMVGDYPLTLYAAHKQKVGYLNYSSSVYRVIENSASHIKDTQNQTKYIQSGYAIKKYFIENYGCEKETEKKINKEYYAKLLFQSFKTKDYKNAKICYGYLHNNNSNLFLYYMLLLGSKNRFVNITLRLLRKIKLLAF